MSVFAVVYMSANTGIIDAGDAYATLFESDFAFTDEEAKNLYERQLAEEIRRVILAYPEISNAKVAIDFGEITDDVVFSSGRDASASVVLSAKEDNALPEQVIQDIAEIIRSSVPGIEYENITITDINLNIYQVGVGNEVIA